MTAPMNRNYGINPDDIESIDAGRGVRGARALGAAVELAVHRALRGTGSPPNASGRRRVDTRQLTRHIRSKGAMRGAVALGDERATPCVRRSPRAHRWTASISRPRRPSRRVHEGPADARRHIVAYDYGMKRNILRLFLKNGCRVTVVPAATSAARIREHAPDGLFLSNGPGDPAAVSYATPRCAICGRSLRSFGIASPSVARVGVGGETAKLPTGIEGEPSGAGSCDRTSTITSQNHGFAVRGDTGGVPGATRLRSRTLTSTTAPSKG